MAAYKIDATTSDGVTVLKVGFADQAQNDVIVRDAAARLAELVAAGELPGGAGVKIYGPASLPVACVLAHAVAHLYGWVGVFDPKLNAYVVCIAHGGEHQVGDLVA
jgi:CRISPR-associated protein Csx3